ncbi:MAG: acetyl-CoA carboxylase carboxyltransferase subunit beta [Fibrobacteria bacterium]|nr:acetyl-CoA carboxylase carboxyltransferase subunit beta [Fibrobacteria bacterium]
MKWFWNAKSGIETQQKKDLPAELWVKCNECKEILYRKELEKNNSVCNHCNFHFPIAAKEYITLLLDKLSFEEMDADLVSNDPLKFTDKKKYSDRLKEYQAKTGLKSAVISGIGTIFGRKVSIGVMDFRFCGGSMGVIEGEKLARVLRKALELQIPAIIVSKSGGARMQEGTLSLMQMAKTAAMIAKLDEAALPYISLLTNPTTGGVTASFAMLGDVNIAEPKALIGFAGSRVIRETIRQELPSNFQKAERLMAKGFLDMIVERKNLKKTLSTLLEHFSSGRLVKPDTKKTVVAAK